ncbi:hypothetical protein E2C01_096286 [Portunus trituberculatus]|uniref:Uncharacterized protein n=1 Tax=Portunus trituberculatus TaxID=210409 RepID=A0A5B7K2M0_PORTR|nr:hypothetical protein [Portunus trituberculatus]
MYRSQGESVGPRGVSESYSLSRRLAVAKADLGRVGESKSIICLTVLSVPGFHSFGSYVYGVCGLASPHYPSEMWSGAAFPEVREAVTGGGLHCVLKIRAEETPVIMHTIIIITVIIIVPFYRSNEYSDACDRLSHTAECLWP